MELYRFSPVFFILYFTIFGTSAQYNQQNQCQPCTATQGNAYQQSGYASQQNQYSGYGYNGCTRCGTGYQYDQSNQYSNSIPSQSGTYSSNGYQNGAYTNQNQQYSNTNDYNYQSQQQSGSMYNTNQQQQGSNQYSGSSSSNTSQPGYLRDYHGDIYTNPQRIKDTQALNAAFFQGIGGEPKYQGAVDGPQQNSTSYTQTGK